MSAQDMPLGGKRAVITGASKGIGRAIATAYAVAGADVALVARDEGELTALAGELRTHGGKAFPIVCDVTDAAAVGKMAEQVLAEMHGIDILVNNAGIARSHKLVGHPDELWNRILTTNLTSVYLVTKALVQPMLDQRSGRIVNIASIAGKVGGRYVIAYTASKHGVIGLTRALAAELVNSGITVNAVCPGYVDTPMTEAAIANITAHTAMSAERARDTLERTNPQQRLIEPEEVASVALFLALETSKGITGQAINVDGGAVMF